MNVLLLTPGFPPLIGGGERYAEALAGQLAQHGHGVTVITSAARQGRDFYRGAACQEPWREDANGTRVLRLPVRPMPGGRPGLLAWRKAMVLLSQLPGDQSRALGRMAEQIPPIVGLPAALTALTTLEPPDLVHAFNLSWEWPAIIGWRFARARGLPLVVTPFLHLGRGRGSREALNSAMDHQRRLLREAAAVLALTAVEAEQLSSLGVEARRVRVVGAGLSAPDAPAAVAGTSAALDVAALPPGPYALFIGRLSRDKGAIVAAEAVQRLRGQGRQLSLLLLGEPSVEFTRWLSRQRGPARCGIVPLGRVEEGVKQALLAQAEMLLLPSVVESFGLVLLEAWQHGKPVIAAAAGGIPGVVRHGENGLLTPPGDVVALADAIARLLDDAALARRLGAAGRAALEEYTWERVYARTLSAYQQALAERRS